MLARKFNARVILFHAIEPYPYSTNDAFMIIDNSEALKKIAQSLLLNAKALLRKKGLKVKSSLTIGNPAREIAERAGKEKADLIVMGTQGKRGVEHVLLGSVAEKVVRLADCPVLTIR
jgi:nucleotide-binding universal stress UspA family protein